MKEKEDGTNIIEVSHDTFNQVVERLVVSSMEQKKAPPAFCLLGPPGIGKSDTVKKIAKDLGSLLKREVVLRIYIPSRRNPNTTTGIPQISSDYAKWIPFEEFRFDDPEKFYVLFIDELPNAPPIIQSCLLGVILDRQLEQFKIPDNVLIIAAGNLSIHSRASFDLIEPMPSRLALFTLRPPTIEDWLVHSREDKVSNYIGAFLYQNPQLLFKESKGIIDVTPRGWTRAGQFITDQSTDEIFQIVASFVGEAAALQMKGWLSIREKLPDLDGAFLLTDKKWLTAIENVKATMGGGKKDNSIGVAMYVLLALSNSERITLNIEQSIKFLEFLPPEFQVIGFRIFRTNRLWYEKIAFEQYQWVTKKTLAWRGE